MQQIMLAVEDFKLLDTPPNGQRNTEVEDVVSVQLSAVEMPTTTVNAAGMAGAMDIPTSTRANAMQIVINHNYGRNSEVLARPGAHQFEFRVALQAFEIATQQVVDVGDKFRITGLMTAFDPGTVEKGNARSGSATYSVSRYEWIRDGKTLHLIDAPGGVFNIDGVNYRAGVNSILN